MQLYNCSYSIPDKTGEEADCLLSLITIIFFLPELVLCSLFVFVVLVYSSCSSTPFFLLLLMSSSQSLFFYFGIIFVIIFFLCLASHSDLSRSSTSSPILPPPAATQAPTAATEGTHKPIPDPGTKLAAKIPNF